MKSISKLKFITCFMCVSSDFELKNLLLKLWICIFFTLFWCLCTCYVIVAVSGHYKVWSSQNHMVAMVTMWDNNSTLFQYVQCFLTLCMCRCVLSYSICKNMYVWNSVDYISQEATKRFSIENFTSILCQYVSFLVRCFIKIWYFVL